jgi:hypothetical protein
VNTKPVLDSNPIATLENAVLADTAKNAPALPGFVSEVSRAFMAPLLIAKEEALRARPAIVAQAFEEYPPSDRFSEALDSARACFKRAREISKPIAGMHVDQVKFQYAKIQKASVARIVENGAGALSGLEDEDSVAKRLANEILALQAAMSAIGFEQIAHAVVIRDEIDYALSSLVSNLRAVDVASAKRYGTETDFSSETRLAASVRVLHARATFGLRNLAKAVPGAGCCWQIVRNTFRDFLPELATW